MKAEYKLVHQTTPFLLGFIAILLICYVFVRSYSLSFTHDESLTYTIIKGDPTFLNTSNHHFLNTYLSKICSYAISDKELSLRLPNSISFIFFIWALISIINFEKIQYSAILFISIVLLNPFLLDFFSLCRGYGISIAFLLSSIFFLIKSMHQLQSFNYRKYYLSTTLSIICMTMALLANLTIINLFISLQAVIALNFIINTKKEIWFKLSTMVGAFILFIFTSIVLFLSIKHLYELKKLGELYFGGMTIIDSFNSLIEQTLYSTSPIITNSICLIFALVFIFGGISIIFNKAYNSVLFTLFLFISIVILGLFIENYLFNAKFPLERTGLYFIPLLGLYVFFLIHHINNHYIKIASIAFVISITLSVVLILNFLLTINISKTKSWLYDAHTKSAMLKINSITRYNSYNKTISNHWLFAPSINYYIDVYKIKLMKTNRNGTNIHSDFIYDIKISTTYKDFYLDTNYGTTFLLIKKK